MTEAYAREILRRNVAQICQTIGWNGINSTPLDILVHVLEKYIRTLSTQANRHAEQFNRTEPNLHDLGLVFRDLHIHLPELTEYVRSVPPVPAPVSVEKFPKPKESNLNFLKPGSHEVVTRPVHVHEHLPPMYPEKERDTPAVAGTVEIRQNGIDNPETSTATCGSPEISVTDSPEKKDIFKRPTDPVSLPNSKRPRLRLDEEERTREISSVMMTMSGFLSPAREGKLPEARPPTMVSDKHYDKHKVNSHAGVIKPPVVDKSDKKSKKNKLLNGKVMKSKRRDKSHKGESSKSKDSAKLNKYPPGYPMKSKEVHPTHHNHVTMPAPRPPVPSTASPRPMMPASPLVPLQEPVKPVIKQEPVDLPSLPPPVPTKVKLSGEDAIPVPRKIPISKSPLVSNSLPVHKQSNSLIPDLEIKKEIVEEEKLASQPDRSKINIFKRISNKSKEDKNTPEVVPDKLQSDNVISRLHNSVHNSAAESRHHDNVRVKAEEPVVNNNDHSAVDMSTVIDLRTNEVISVDDDSMDRSPFPPRQLLEEPRPSLSINKSLQVPFPKDVASVSPKPKKEKKHKDKKDKAAKLEAKLLKKQQQQLAFEMAQAERQKYESMKMSGLKPTKSSRKNESKAPQLPPGFPFFPSLPTTRGLVPGLLPGGDFLHLSGNPALRGLPAASNFLTNPFALSPGAGLLPGGYLAGAGYSPPARKLPPMLRRPSLEVIPVDHDDRGPPPAPRPDNHKPQTIPNILQKKSKSHKDHKASLYKMPPVQPDITIELNPPREIRPEIKKEAPEPPPRAPAPAPAPQRAPEPPPEPEPLTVPEPMRVPVSEIKEERDLDASDKKKDKSHKKDKKDKDGIKIKKKKDKKDKNKDKGEKKRDKEDRQELREIKDKIKKEKREKKKEKAADGPVPKLTLKFSSSNSNSPMPPSSPEVFKLSMKPAEEAGGSPRAHSRSPELAQISALVTRPPKPRRAEDSPPPEPAKPRKNRPPSGTKYKRLLFKPLKKAAETFDDDAEPAPEAAPAPATPATLPTPYYLDEQGNKIWVCPACGRPDNGSPMIGCDGCDGWYHWVCVGITEEPGATEDWFCSACLARRAAAPGPHRRRGRKPKADK